MSNSGGKWGKDMLIAAGILLLISFMCSGPGEDPMVMFVDLFSEFLDVYSENIYQNPYDPYEDPDYPIYKGSYDLAYGSPYDGNMFSNVEYLTLDDIENYSRSSDDFSYMFDEPEFKSSLSDEAIEIDGRTYYIDQNGYIYYKYMEGKRYLAIKE